MKILYKLNSKGLSSTEKTWLLAEEVSTAIVIKALITPITVLNVVMIFLILGIEMLPGQKALLVIGFDLLFFERFVESAKLAFLTQLHLKDNAVKREVYNRVDAALIEYLDKDTLRQCPINFSPCRTLESMVIDETKCAITEAYIAEHVDD